MRILTISFCCVICALLLGSCEKATTPITNAQETTAQPTSQPAVATSIDTTSEPTAWAPSDDPTIARFLNYVAPKSATWIEHPPSGMGRIANYTVPGRDGNQAAHIVVHYFGPGQGGSVEGNITRWQSQFQVDDDGSLPEPIVNRFEVNSLAVTTIELSGQWKDRGALAFKPDQIFLAAIIELPQGNLFIRLVGQSATVKANKEDYLAMIRGINAADQD